MKIIITIVFGLLTACCGESSTVASRKEIPNPVVAYVGDGEQEQELTANGFKLELFEGGGFRRAPTTRGKLEIQVQESPNSR